MKTLTLFLFATLTLNISTFAQMMDYESFSEERIAKEQENKIKKDDISPLVMVQRCVAQSTYTDQVFTDSLRQVFTHPRGSVGSKNAFNVGSAPDTLYRIALNSNIASVVHYSTYNTENKILKRVHLQNNTHVGTDTFNYVGGNLTSFISNFDDGNNLKMYQETVYNGNGKLEYDSFYRFSYIPNQQASNNFLYCYKYQYDNQARVTEVYNNMSFNNFTIFNRKITKHFYQGSNTKPFLDSIFNIANNGVITKSAKKMYYLPNGKLNTDTTFNQSGNATNVSIYTYNGLETTKIDKVYNGTQWINASKSVSKENSDGNNTLSEIYTWTNGNWIIYYRHTNTYNANGFLIGTHTSSGEIGTGNLITTRKDTIDRNGYNNSTKWTYQRFQNGNIAEEITNYYYYEDYDNGVGIADINPKIKVNVYPNPAQAVLNINFEESIQSEFQILVFDFTGKLMFHHQTKLKENKIDIDKLADGQYLLILSDKNGRSIFSQKFLKK